MHGYEILPRTTAAVFHLLHTVKGEGVFWGFVVFFIYELEKQLLYPPSYLVWGSQY